MYGFYSYRLVYSYFISVLQYLLLSFVLGLKLPQHLTNENPPSGCYVIAVCLQKCLGHQLIGRRHPQCSILFYYSHEFRDHQYQLAQFSPSPFQPQECGLLSFIQPSYLIISCDAHCPTPKTFMPQLGYPGLFPVLTYLSLDLFNSLTTFHNVSTYEASPNTSRIKGFLERRREGMSFTTLWL